MPRNAPPASRRRSSNRAIARLREALRADVRGGADARDIVAAAARALEVPRASFWRYEPARGALVCVALLVRRRPRERPPDPRARARHPAYFAALDTGRLLAASDVRRHRGVRELRAAGLDAAGVASLLHAPVLRDGRLEGVLCLEQVGARRAWTADDRLLAAAYASRLALGIAREARRQSGREARRERGRLQSLVDLGADWYWEHDLDGRLTHFVYSTVLPDAPRAQDLIGRARWELPHEDVSPEQWAAHRAVIAARQPYRDFQIALRRADGSRYWISVSGEPMVDEAGRCTGYRGIGADITARRRDEMRLRESERSLASMLANLPGYAYRCRDAHGWPILFASQGAVDITGWRAEELVAEGFDFSALMEPADVARCEAEVARAVAAGGAWSLEYPIHARGGERRWVLDRGRGVLSERGELLFLEGLITDVTQRRELHDELARLNAELQGEVMRRAELLALVTEHVPVMIAYFDTELVLRFANRAYARSRGVASASELLGKSLPALLGPERMALNRPHFERALAGESVRFELPGRERGALDAMLVPDVGADGRVRGVFGTLVDITERKATESELRDAAVRMRTILDVAPYVVFVKDRDGRYLLVNRAGAEIYGRAPEGVVGRTAAEVDMDRAALESTDALDAEVRRTGRTLRTEFRIVDARGDVRQFMTVRTPIRFSDAHPDAVLAVGVDITERKAQEDALRAAEEQLRLVAENIPAIVARFDAGLVCRYANGAYLETAGLPRESVVGMHLRDIVGPARAAAAMSRASAAVDGATQRFENLRYGVRERIFDSVLVPYVDPAGVRDGYFVFGIDVTERRGAEASRRELEAQLRESQKLEAIGTLAGGIAHDFNNILGVILGNAGLATRHAEGQPQLLESLAQVVDAGTQGRDLVQQILAFSRRQPQALRTQPLGPLVEKTLRLLRSMVPAAVQIEVRVASPGVLVRADETQVGQVLMNLCTNAWQAFGGSHGRIEVLLDEVSFDAAVPGPDGVPAGRYARIAVRDDGPGMDEATRRRIFEPFFTTKEGFGTGLGLSVVHGIARAHGGAIAVASEPGRGACFEVLLPVAASDAATVPAAAAESAPRRIDGARVLYVDDNAAMVLLVERLLADLGGRVSGHMRPEEALDALRADPAGFDLLVTDFNMPGLSGIDVAREARRVAPGVPVVVTSGFVTDELVAQARAVGVREVLHKPDTFDALAHAIGGLLVPPGPRP